MVNGPQQCLIYFMLILTLGSKRNIREIDLPTPVRSQENVSVLDFSSAFVPDLKYFGVTQCCCCVHFLLQLQALLPWSNPGYGAG